MYFNFQIELQPRMGYWFIGPLLRIWGRNAMERRRWPLTLFLNGVGKVTDARAGLNVSNRVAAYVFLVDSNGLIRWKAVGLASPEEIDAMILVTKQLIEGEQPSLPLHSNGGKVKA